MIRRAIAVGVVRFAFAFAVFALAAVGYRVASGRADRPPWWLAAAAAVLVALLLHVTRERTARLAERLAYGRQAAGVAGVHELIERLSGALPVDEVLPRLAQAVARDRTRAEVRVWLADGGQRSQAWPALAAPDGTSVAVDVHYGGGAVGEIEVDVGTDRMSAFDRRLLDELAGPAGLALSMVRLTVELERRRDQLVEVNAGIERSSERMLAARAEQQHRVRAELAADVLPHLEAAGSAVDAGVAREQAQQALDALRRLTRGIYPPRLEEDGIGAAVDGWLDRSGRHVRLTSTDAEAPGPAAEVGAAGYFCAVTALDAVPGAGELDVSADADLVLTVRGTGRVDAAALQLVRDRAEAFGGSCVVTSGEGVVAVACRLPMIGDEAMDPAAEAVR